jgi:hypothetical protein
LSGVSGRCSLLDRHSLGLGDAEEGKGEGQGETTGPDKGDTGSNDRLDLRGGKAALSAEPSLYSSQGIILNLRNDQVEEPVGTGAEGDTEVAQSHGEGLSADDPGDRTPGRGKGGDEDTGESDEDLSGDRVIRVSLGDGTDNDLTDEHDGGTPEKDGSSTGSVDSEDTGEGHEDVDTGKDDLEDVGVVETGGLGELNTVGEEEVDTWEEGQGGFRDRDSQRHSPVICWPIWTKIPIMVRQRIRSLGEKHSEYRAWPRSWSLRVAA